MIRENLDPPYLVIDKKLGSGVQVEHNKVQTAMPCALRDASFLDRFIVEGSGRRFEVVSIQPKKPRTVLQRIWDTVSEFVPPILNVFEVDEELRELEPMTAKEVVERVRAMYRDPSRREIAEEIGFDISKLEAFLDREPSIAEVIQYLVEHEEGGDWGEEAEEGT